MNYYKNYDGSYHLYNRINKNCNYNYNKYNDVYFSERQIPVNREFGTIELYVFTIMPGTLPITEKIIEYPPHERDKIDN